MQEVVIMEWTYTPGDYFEEKFEQFQDRFNLEIDNGKVQAVIPASVFDKNNSILEEIDEQIKALFMGIMICTHNDYKLSAYTDYRLLPDGKKAYTLRAQKAVFKLTLHAVELRLGVKEDVPVLFPAIFSNLRLPSLR
ncbi:MAG: hypothetical protein LC768_17495, partial [Acidobacteria bacterium]|nr:hypothetical protein [Acidobacteriota bacterium]